MEWTTQRRCIFNRIFQDNVLCIASPSTGDLHEFVRRITEISTTNNTLRGTYEQRELLSVTKDIFPTDSHNSRRVEKRVFRVTESS